MRAIVASGGGVKGAYQVGVLQKLLIDDGLDYEIMCGVSVGAINVAYLAQAKLGNPKQAFEHLRNLWLSINDKQIKQSWALGPIAALWSQSVFNTQPLIDLIKTKLDVKAIAASGRRVRVGAVNWETAEYASGTENDPDFALWVLASSAFPAMFTPIRIKNELWGDGGMRNVTPLGEAIHLGATEVDVIMCSNPDVTERWNPDKQAAISGFAMRAIDIQADEVIRGDLDKAYLKNEMSLNKPSYRRIKIRLFQPSEVLAKNSLDFDAKAILRMMDIGYRDARSYKEK